MGSTRLQWDVAIPLARTKALTRAVVWGMCVVVMLAAAYPIYSGLNFSSSVVSGRLVDFSIATVASPILFGALYCLFKSSRWLLLCLWPAPIGVFANKDELVLRLGCFGTWRFDASEISVKYPFELSADLDGGEFESFLPEEEQRATLLPRITHPQSPESINRTIQRYVDATETELASCLRQVLAAWRGEETIPQDATGQESRS